VGENLIGYCRLQLPGFDENVKGVVLRRRAYATLFGPGSELGKRLARVSPESRIPIRYHCSTRS
jgi:hypothetical protein